MRSSTRYLQLRNYLLHLSLLPTLKYTIYCKTDVLCNNQVAIISANGPPDVLGLKKPLVYGGPSTKRIWRWYTTYPKSKTSKLNFSERKKTKWLLTSTSKCCSYLIIVLYKARQKRRAKLSCGVLAILLWRAHKLPSNRLKNTLQYLHL